MPHEIGVFVRSEAELERARAAVAKAGLPFKVLDEHVNTSSGQVSISAMHLAKGLEFRAVSLMACDDEITPLQSRIETVTAIWKRFTTPNAICCTSPARARGITCS